LQWNVEDPVSQVEINRNTILEGVQEIETLLLTTLFNNNLGGPQAQNRFDGTIVLDTEVPSVPANLYAINTTATGTTLAWVQSNR
jgi:hypothetical protein